MMPEPPSGGATVPSEKTRDGKRDGLNVYRTADLSRAIF